MQSQAHEPSGWILIPELSAKARHDRKKTAVRITYLGEDQPSKDEVRGGTIVEVLWNKAIHSRQAQLSFNLLSIPQKLNLGLQGACCGLK